MIREVGILEQLERSALLARRYGEGDTCMRLLTQRAKLVRAMHRHDPDVDCVHRESIEILREVVDVGILDKLVAALEGRSVKPVGFWWSRHQPYLPRAQDHVDASWDPAERLMVIHYLLGPGHSYEAFYGESDCRFCGKSNGNKDVTDGVWIWPSGLVHYLRDHGVKPPADFIEYVRSRSMT